MPPKQFLPPTPDNIFYGINVMLGETARTPLRAMKALGDGITNTINAIGMGLERVIDEFEKFPRRE